MLLLDVTYLCKELDAETGGYVEGENACHLRVAEDWVTVLPDARVVPDPWVMTWLEDAISALERLQGRTYLLESIRDIRLAKKEG